MGFFHGHPNAFHRHPTIGTRVPIGCLGCLWVPMGFFASAPHFTVRAQGFGHSGAAGADDFSFIGWEREKKRRLTPKLTPRSPASSHFDAKSATPNSHAQAIRNSRKARAYWTCVLDGLDGSKSIRVVGGVSS